MRKILFLTSALLLTCCLGNTSNDNSLKSKYSEAIENFDEFIEKFYNDTSFQKERIITPLNGEKKFWDDNEDIVITIKWEDKEIPKVTSFDEILESMNRATRDFVKEESKIKEKIFIPNSGFYMHRTFKLQNKQWYLVKYDISYL